MFSTNYNQATIFKDCSPLNSICIEVYIYSIDIYVAAYQWNHQSKMNWTGWIGDHANYQSCWIHLAFVFDHQKESMLIYFNGGLVQNDSFPVRSFATTEVNQKLPTYFGSNSTSKDATPFDGLIDQFTVSYYQRNSSAIQDEATLLCSYNFDRENVNNDSGPNNIQAYSEKVYGLTSGSLNEQHTLLFNSSDSYFQTSDFTLLMSNLYSFTFAFWLRPVLLPSDQADSAVAILQLATKVQQISSETFVCLLDLYIVNITSNSPQFRFTFGQLNMYWLPNITSVKNNTWTHFAVTYINQSILYIYINGVGLDGMQDAQFSLLLNAPRLSLTIGGSYFVDTVPNKPTNYQSRKCFAERPEYNFTQFHGEIDELRFYARQLTDLEYHKLASTKNTSAS